MARKTNIQHRRDTAANWTATNPTLASGEIGYETDTGKFKMGDGATAWAGLAYFQTGAGSGVGTITSSGGTISVTNPSGPTANVDLPNSGVAAGTYGDATHVSQVTVTADGIVTAASAIAITGGAANLTVLFNSTLGADAASIDTGANGIAQTASHLLIYFTGRTTQAVTLSATNMTLNGDSTAVYDRYSFTVTGTAGAQGSAYATNSWGWAQTPGSSADANVQAVAVLFIPDYTSSKVHNSFGFSGHIATAATGNSVAAFSTLRYRTAAAITQLTATANSGNLVAGSRLTIYGLG